MHEHLYTFNNDTYKLNMSMDFQIWFKIKLLEVILWIIIFNFHFNLRLYNIFRMAQLIEYNRLDYT